ncbi:DNA cytosine methyltransferase [Pseudoneobacillus sp. C159]
MKKDELENEELELDTEEAELINAVTLNKPGRGKFKPAPNYNPDDVKKILFEKIEEELTNKVEETSDFDESELDNKDDRFNLVSLFCGAGGLDLGVELAGLAAVIGEERALEAFKDKDYYNSVRHESIFHKIYANDFFKEALETSQKNFPESAYFHNKDIRKIHHFPKGDIVLGGFPCPGFSEAGPRLVDDERNFLYLHFIRCLIQAKPKVFIAENVKGMMTLGKGEVFKQIKQDFAAAGYRIYDKLLNGRDYGVAQIRERVFLVGVREDIDFEYIFPEPTHGDVEPTLFNDDPTALKPYVTLEEVIGDLRDNPGPYFTGSYSTIFMSRNRKKRWDEQSFTIQASGRQAPIHPGGLPMEKLGPNEWIFPDGEENNRRLSVKEIARIQSFPDWWEFSDGGNMKVSENNRIDKLYKQIGNAVPVLLAYAVAKPIAEWAVRQLAEQNQQELEPVRP